MSNKSTTQTAASGHSLRFVIFAFLFLSMIGPSYSRQVHRDKSAFLPLARPYSHLSSIHKTSHIHLRPIPPSFQAPQKPTITHQRKHTPTSLQMFLPPGPGNDNKLQTIITPILVSLALILFFVSPLGGIFFAITNTLLILAFLTPVLILAGIQVWSALNTIEGQCPNCSSNVVVLKEGDPSICLNCGSLVRATIDKDGIELCNVGVDPFVEEESGGIFDAFGLGKKNLEDDSERAKRARRERTVIDVDAEKE